MDRLTSCSQSINSTSLKNIKYNETAVQNSEIISNNIRNLRIAVRCSLKIFAWVHEVTPYFIKKWESGKGYIPTERLKMFANQAACAYDIFCNRALTTTEIQKARSDREIRISVYLYRQSCKKQKT